MRLDLGDYLPYLLNRAGTRIAVSFTAAVRQHGITLPMWRALAALHYDEGQRMGELGRLTSIDVSTLTRIVDGLERRGLIERRRSDSDARSVRVHLTAAGRSLTERIIPLAEHYETVALSGFSAEEAALLKAMLRRLHDNMDQLDETDLPLAKTG